MLGTPEYYIKYRITKDPTDNLINTNYGWIANDIPVLPEHEYDALQEVNY
jgi:hypothetical protein